MHKKLNAVMQMDPPGSRRRVARNPIAEQHQQQDSLSPTPADADSSNDAASSGGGGAAGECRRSSRKKTIKFDVRDLLNKTRKNHKIQIEARIDSNAPTNKASGTGAASSKAELDSKQKNFIEKSAIFRRYSISENKLPPRPPPPPGALIHTIQQCVGELEQLPLAESGELNLAAISPIARRLSRTQDILTASMIKPKQVSSLIVTKLESASTAKAVTSSTAVEAKSMPTRRRAAERCEPSTSNAATAKNKQQKVVQKRGRKPKAKVFDEPSTKPDLFSICTSSSPSSSIDGYATHIPVAENGNEPIETVNSSDSSDNSTTGIDLKENLDASAVTLPLPTIPADDCARNSSDESIAATEEDTFSIQNLSSDESIASSSKGMKANDEISLFGRSNSTDTTSSDNSEKRQRKVRIAVKRVSLTPQFLQSPSMSPHYPQSPQSPGLPQSPLGSSSEEPPPPKEGDTVDPQSSTNDDVSNDKATEAASSSSISALKQFKENMPLVEPSCTTPPVATDGDTTSVDSSVVETVGLNEVIATATITNSSVQKRRGRSKANKEQLATATTDMPNTQEQFPFKTNNRSSSARRQIHQQPTETLTASITPAKSLEVVAQPLAQEVASSATYTPSDDTSLIQNQKPRSPKSPSEETGPVKNDSNDSNSTAVPKIRSLRSAQNNLESLPQLTLPTRQRKSNKVSSPVIEDPPAAENNAKADVSPVLDNSSQIEIESAQESIAEEKITRSRASKKKLDQGDPVLTDKNQTIPAKDGLSTSADKKETNISKPESESTTDRSSTDETASSDRRESPRLRSSASLAMTKIIPNKVFTAVSSSTPDSESSAESTDGREKSSKTKTLNKTKPITNSEKVSEENSGMCSESSSITSSSTSTSSASSTSSSSMSASDASSKSSAGTSSSTSSSSSGSSSSTSSTSSEGRSTRSSKEEARKSPLKSAVLDRVKSSARSDSECSEKSSTSDDMRFKTLETLSQRRKTARLERLNRWSSEGSESSCSTVSRTRSDGSKGRVEDTNSPKDETPIANKTNEYVPETPLENSSHATSQPRSKSKKRTRRFVPIKYSSSESGSLSDDNVSSRMTRTRRKTISSASDFDELPSNNLKPPDLALEYLPRKSKLGMAKSQADLSKIGTDDEAIKPRRSRSKKGMRNSSRCRSQSTVAPKSDLTLKDTKGVQEINDYSQPASSTSSASSYSSSSTEDTQTKDLPQRKITRLSLKNQNSDSGNSELQTKNTNSDSNNDHVSQVMPTLVPDCEETIKDDGKVLECKSQAGQIIVEPENSTSQIKSPESEASNSVKSSPKHKKATKSNREKSEGDTIDEASGMHKEKDQDQKSDPSKENIEEPPSNFRRITRLSPKNLEVVTAEAKSNEKPVEKEEPEVIKKVTRSSLKKIEIIVNSSPDTIKEKTSDSEDKDFVSIPDLSKEQVEISPKAREVGTISPKSTEEQQKQFDEVLQDLEVPSPGLRSKATSHSTTNQQEEEPNQLDNLQAVDRVFPEKTIQEEPKEIPLESEHVAEEHKLSSPSPGSKTMHSTPKQQEKESKQVDSLQSDEKATAVEQTTLESAVQEPVSVESPKRKRQSTRAAAATKTPTKPKTEGKKGEPNAVVKTSDDLNSVPIIQTPENDQIVKVPRQLRKMTRFSPRVPENTQTQQDESMVEKLTLENETEKNDVQPLAESAELREQENATRETETNRTLPTAVVEVSSDNLQNEKDQKQTIDDCRVQEPVPSIQAIEVQAVKTRTRKGTRFSPLVSQTTIHEITTKSTEIEVPQKVSEDQVISNTESPISSSLPPVLKSQDSNSTEDEVVPKRDAIELPPSASNSSPQSKKSDYASKKVIKQQLQSMLDSLTLVGSKTTPPKETTPRRKKKTLTPVAAPPSSDSNQSNEPMKQTQEEPTQKIDQKPATPRRKLDSSFIESLEKSLLRSAKKASKKKEKDKAAIAQILTPTPTTKEESSTKKSTSPTNSTTPKPIEQCELKKPVETPSPKLKKKQPKESPKLNKKLEDQNQAKRKNLEKTKKSEESSFANIFKDVAVTTHPQPPKTKAETKFFSPGKSSIEYEPPSPPQSQPPVVQDVSPQLPVEVIKEKSPDLIPDPLKDIEKFIEDGVNLLKRTYKIDADDDASLDRDILKPDDIMTPKKCKLDENVVEAASTPTANSQGTSPPDDDNSNSNSECSTLTSLTNTSTSEIDTPNGIRRSHRIKNNSKSTKCLVGRGLVRERERFSTKDDEKTIYSIDDQKMDLAEVEAKNSKFLKDMEERLSNFRVIRENEYKCERVISKEAKRMLCDCFLTAEEEERGELGCGEDCLNRLLMIECGTDCTVRERCTNRRFNKFLYSPCRVFRTEKKGFGIMADIEILPGEFIMEYVGEVINGDEFEIRINEYSKDKNKHYYFMALRSDAVIDATAKGNISRFINHSCDPNAETQKWTVNGELRIGFFSRKSIMPGEEITFDYQYQRYGKEAQRCYCESSNCRGWIGAEPSSEEEEEEEVDEEDESEETEEEEPTGAVAPVLPVIPSPIPLDVSITDAEKNLIAPTLVAGAEVSAIAAAGEVDKPPQPVLDPSVPSPTPTTPAPTPTPTVPDMLKPPTLLPKKTKKEKKRLHEEKLKRREPKQFLEDPDIEDEVRFLVKCGLRNQADTLRLSRLIVRAKLLETRIKLLQILRKAELPCRRLFLDYHGLRLLHGWMSEVIDTRNSEENLEIRMELLSVLECLPIPNKTMLNDSKVYYTVRDWSNNKESHSPSDRSPKESNSNSSEAPVQPMSTEAASSELQKLAAKLVHTWNNLPEVFRIPKRERIEQMKEHEREADRQYKDFDRDSVDRNRNRERFVSKNGKKGRFKWSKEKERDRRKFAQNSSNSGKDCADKSSTLAGGDSHLSKEQRRELFAAKVARDEAEKRLAEERREFDIKCRFFGLDPKRIRPENMPFCVNPSTGQWFSTDRKPIATPPSYAHVQVPVKPKSTNPQDYRLPPMDLPPLWKFAISPKGKIYYYHVKIRIPQWEPPIKILPLSGQNDAGSMKNSESDSSNTAPNESSEDDIEVIKGLDPVKLQAYIEKRIENRRLQRYTRLVEEKPISPRKEEDRIYNQMEVRKYKENKEKIRKRKEEIRKRRDIIGLPPAATVAAVESSTSTNAAETTAKDGAEPLPIQDYLLSSEEEELLKAKCNNSPLIDKIVQGDKIVDELDALHRKRSLKRALPIRDKYDHKKRKQDKNKESSKSTKRSKDGEGSSSSSSSSSKYRKVREKFRCEIAGIIVQHLKPYRGEACSNGRILTDDDFNHLARKLTHFVMVKELKYCESVGQTLIVTESVKNKSREFIKKYMAKYGKVYVRPKNDPEFKDIPFL